MKLSIKILITTFLLLLGSLLYSNIVLKREYDKLDKSDRYWTYAKILGEPFKYLKITGGNLTNIAFEQSPKYSVRILRDWAGYREGRVRAQVINDTLLVDFPQKSKDLFEKYWMRNQTLVRIFSPELLSVECFNTNLGMFKMKQKSITVIASGKSSFELESLYKNLDSLNISQKDSSEVVFEMSPDFSSGQSATTDRKTVITDTSRPGLITITSSPEEIKSKEAMTIRSVKADVQGRSLLDLGHAQINSLKLTIADSSAIILSGSALKKGGIMKQD
jgi:hypothetical protein